MSILCREFIERQTKGTVLSIMQATNFLHIFTHCNLGQQCDYSGARLTVINRDY